MPCAQQGAAVKPAARHRPATPVSGQSIFVNCSAGRRASQPADASQDQSIFVNYLAGRPAARQLLTKMLRPREGGGSLASLRPRWFATHRGLPVLQLAFLRPIFVNIRLPASPLPGLRCIAFASIFVNCHPAWPSSLAKQGCQGPARAYAASLGPADRPGRAAINKYACGCSAAQVRGRGDAGGLQLTKMPRSLATFAFAFALPTGTFFCAGRFRCEGCLPGGLIRGGCFAASPWGVTDCVGCMGCVRGGRTAPCGALGPGPGPRAPGPGSGLRAPGPRTNRR